MISFVVPAIPVAQPRQRHALIAGHVRNYTPASHPVQAFKATCRLVASEAHSGPPIEHPIRLRVEFVLPRPKLPKKAGTERMPHTKRPDIENLAKSLMDSLNGLIWKDDAQVFSARFTKSIADACEQPHVEVTIDWWEE